jgi:hypothetical protein
MTTKRMRLHSSWSTPRIPALLGGSPTLASPSGQSAAAEHSAQKFRSACRSNEVIAGYPLSACLELIRECRIALFAIDDPHRISQWGHDFCRNYQALGILKQSFSDVPLIRELARGVSP